MAAEKSSESKQGKWEGKLLGEVKGVTAEQVWPLLEDFANVHKCMTNIDVCKLVEGVSGQPGCVRYCAKTTITTPATPGSSPESEEKKMETTMWAHEKLIAIDPVERYVSYEVTENNLGMKFYMATMKVLQISKEKANEGCQIEWTFVADPVEGWTFEGLLSFFESSLQSMVQMMENAFSPSTQT